MFSIHISVHMYIIICGCSENSVTLNPMVLLIIIPFLNGFMIIIPMKNGYFIGNIPNIFRHSHMYVSLCIYKSTCITQHRSCLGLPGGLSCFSFYTICPSGTRNSPTWGSMGLSMYRILCIYIYIHTQMCVYVCTLYI